MNGWMGLFAALSLSPCVPGTGMQVLSTEENNAGVKLERDGARGGEHGQGRSL